MTSDTLLIEAGLGFDQAIKRVVAKSDTMISHEFGLVLRQLGCNISRRDALLSVVERTGVADISLFDSAVLQAEQLGSSSPRCYASNRRRCGGADVSAPRPLRARHRSRCSSRWPS